MTVLACLHLSCHLAGSLYLPPLGSVYHSQPGFFLCVILAFHSSGSAVKIAAPCP